ncbi:MAG: signal peptidase II [Bacilli bacterium]|jgi:signal peptidase II|nr:signal peptidase II [Bacilli bacterium]
MKKRSLFMIIIFLIGLDQLSKYMITSNMELYQEINIIPHFFSIYYTVNDGAAFSILKGHLYLFYIVALVGLIVIYNIYKGATTTLTKVACALLTSGLLGNLIDRIINKQVIDFISFTFNTYHFAIFNLADSFITVAIVLIIFDTLGLRKFFKKKEN